MIFYVQMIVYIKDKCTTDTTQVQLCFFLSEEDNSVANQQKFAVHNENGFVYMICTILFISPFPQKWNEHTA